MSDTATTTTPTMMKPVAWWIYHKNDKATVIEYLEYLLKRRDDSTLNNGDILKLLYLKRWMYLSDTLLNDEKFAMTFVAIGGMAFLDTLPQQQQQQHYNNKRVVMKALQATKKFPQAMDEAEKVLLLKEEQFQKLPEAFRDDSEIALAALDKNRECYPHISDRLRQDDDFVLQAVQNDGLCLHSASVHHKESKHIVLAAVSNRGPSLRFASDSLRNDKEVVLAAVSNDGQSIQFANYSFRKDKDVVLVAVSNCGEIFQYVDPSLRNDKDVVLQAVRNYGKALYYVYVGNQLNDDKEVVLEAVRNYGGVLWKASIRLKDDYEVVLAAVQSDNSRYALRYASERLQANKEIVLEAIRNSRLNLVHYISEHLQGEKEVWMELVRHEGSNLKHVDKSLHPHIIDDEEIVKLAISSSVSALQFASKRLQQEPSVALDLLCHHGHRSKCLNKPYHCNELQQSFQEFANRLCRINDELLAAGSHLLSSVVVSMEKEEDDYDYDYDYDDEEEDGSEASTKRLKRTIQHIDVDAWHSAQLECVHLIGHFFKGNTEWIGNKDVRNKIGEFAGLRSTIEMATTELKDCESVINCLIDLELTIARGIVQFPYSTLER